VAADLSRANVAILGVGAVGEAFGEALLECARDSFRGRLTLWSRTPGRVAGFLGPRPSWRRRVRVAASLREAVEAQELVLLCVSDDALPTVARALARLAPTRGARPVVLIASGFFALRRLALLRRAGYALGRLHPLTPIRREVPLLPLLGSPFGVEGDARALRTARTVAGWMHGELLPLSGTAGAAEAYHAGAALFGGGLIALFALAESVMAPAVHAPRATLRAALDDFASTLSIAAQTVGPEQALTGPLARGAEPVVRGHLRALRKVPRAVEAYRTLGVTMLALSRARGSIDAATERRLARLLSGGARER